MTGQIIAHYEIIDKLGEGGMGAVYLAEDAKLHRRVALKFLPAGLLVREEHKTRFAHEARAAAALNHPNIATVYEINEAQGEIFIAMEYIEGQTLQEKIKAGPLNLKEVFNIALQTASGLYAAHDRGIIHRDIKSANIMLAANGLVKITDFGLAKLPVATKLTMDGSTLGTISYMSPEQAVSDEIDHRADLWSLGVVIYEMVSGRLPFRGNYEQAVIYAILNQDPEPLTAIRTGVPIDLERTVNKLLMKEPSARYQHADEVVVDINAIDLKSVLSSRSKPTPSTKKSKAWSWFSLQAMGWGVLGLILGCLFMAGLLGRSSPPSPSALEDIEELSIPLLSTQRLALSGEGNDLALSPDGKTLAYIANAESGRRLYLRTIGRIDRDVEIPGSENANHLFFSQDGNVLGFQAAGRFMKVNPADPGRLPQLIAPVAAIPNGATWQDNDTVIFAHGNEGLFRISVGARVREQLIIPDAEKGEIGFFWPEMLPGGEAVLFTIWRGEDLNKANIAILSLETNEVTNLGVSGANARYVPTGQLVYATWDNSATGRIMAVPFDLDRRVVTGIPEVILAGVDVRQRGPVSFSFSGSGRLAYFRQTNTSRSLVWVDRSGNQTPLTDEKRGYTDPSISPDGKLVAFVINADIYVLDITQGITYRTPISKTTGGSNFEPVWHPDSDLLVFSSDRSGRFHLYAMSVEGDEDPELIVHTEHEPYASSWSPDGEILAYYVRKTQDDRDIYLWSQKDGKAFPFLTTEANERAPMFSPDGQWIAYMSNKSGRDEIWVRPYPPKEEIAYQVSTDGGTEAVWWPDAPLRGQLLSYRQGDQMMLVEVETEPLFQVKSELVHFEGRYYKTLYRSEYAIHPHDDRFLMVDEEETYNQINITLNWFENLEHSLIP